MRRPVIGALIRKAEKHLIGETHYHTSLGTLKPEVTIDSSTFNEKVFGFLGLPYAEVPTGKLRFQPPQPISERSTSNSFRDCSKYKSNPLQPPDTGPDWKWHVDRSDMAEDCLHLHVWTLKRNLGHAVSRPVLVWLYGGGFLQGSANLPIYHGASLAARLDVVLVSVNYRLGPLGFLCLPEANVHGNQGIQDQRLALQWVQENIRGFGGDPQRVTLIGESAGAVSVSLHMVHEPSWNLHESVILQSGAFTCPWATVGVDEMARRSRLFAEKMGAPEVSDDLAKLRHLLTIPAEKLVAPENCMLAEGTCMWTWLPLQPSARSRVNPHCRVFFQLTSNEGSCFLDAQCPELSRWDDCNEHNQLNKFLTRTLEYFPAWPVKCSAEIQHKLAAEYVHFQESSSTTIDHRSRLCELASDWLFEIPLVNFVRSLDRPVRGFRFDHSPNETVRLTPPWFGAGHGDELPYMFGRPLDKKMQDRISQKCLPYDEAADVLIVRQMDYLLGLICQQKENALWPSFDSGEALLVRSNGTGRPQKTTFMNEKMQKKLKFWNDLV